MARSFPFALLALSLMVVGCTANRDTDEDLLLDSIELAIGTDPELADTDGDGFDDGEEYLRFFDPNDADDFPYEGGYPRLPLPDEFDGEGWNEGDVTRDWDGEDSEEQFEEQVNISKFYGNVVLIDIAAEWCGPCREAAPEAQAEYEELKERGFVIINLLLDGVTTDEPPDLDRWREEFDLTFPVVGDHDQSIAGNYIDSSDGGFSIPNFSILGRDLTIEAKYSVGSPDWGLIEDLLDEDLPEVDWPLPENVDELRESLEIEVPDIPYLVPGEGMPDGSGTTAGSISSADGAGSGGSDVADSSYDSEDVKAGRYAGPPFGGASCNTAADSQPSGLLALLLLSLGTIGLRRRN